MPKANVKKTKSALSSRAPLIIVLILVLISFTTDSVDHHKKQNGCAGLNIDQYCIPLERAETNNARVKGLSDREALNADTGMLFVFDASNEQCFWMKDMHFSLDMIWLNAEKQIVKIETDVAPSTYPTSFCADDTRYVIELNSGDVQKHNLTTGQQLIF